MVSNATSVSFKDVRGGWNSSRKKSMTFIVVKSKQRHKKWKVKWKKWEKWEVCNMIKLSLGISQVFWEWQELSFLFRNFPWNLTLWMTLHAANTETPNKSLVTLWKVPVAENVKAISTYCISVNGRPLLVWCWRYLSKIFMRSMTESFLLKAKTQSKVFVVVFLLWVQSIP